MKIVPAVIMDSTKFPTGHFSGNTWSCLPSNCASFIIISFGLKNSCRSQDDTVLRNCSLSYRVSNISRKTTLTFILEIHCRNFYSQFLYCTAVKISRRSFVLQGWFWSSRLDSSSWPETADSYGGPHCFDILIQLSFTSSATRSGLRPVQHLLSVFVSRKTIVSSSRSLPGVFPRAIIGALVIVMKASRFWSK